MSTLGEKYDQLYPEKQGDKDIDSALNVSVKPVRVNSWPTDRHQALVYLARPGGRLLEIGCGQGQVLATLAPHFDEVIGTELSITRAERTRQNLAYLPNCRILNESLETLGTTATLPFDCIIWADVIEHIVDVIETMHLVAGLSRPGTQLVTVTPNVAYLPQRLRLLRGWSPNTSLPLHRNEGFTDDPAKTILRDGGHLHYFTFRQVEILYQIAGFKPEQRMGIGGRLSRFRNYWPTLLSGAVCVSGVFQGETQG